MKSQLKFLSVLAVIAYSFVGPGSANAQTGPVAYWAFDESSDTTLVDSSGNGNTAYIHTGTRVAGVKGNGLSFNGTSDYAHADNSSTFAISNQMSIECWVKARQLNPVTGSQLTFIRKEKAYCLGIGSFGQIGFRICDTSGTWHGDAGWLSAPLSIDTSNWYHIAGIWDGQSMKVYINGILDLNLAYNGSGPSPTKYSYPVNIGEFVEGTNKEGFNGILDEIKIYNYAISFDTILAHYKTVVPIAVVPYTPNPTYNRRPQLHWYSNSAIATYRIQIDTTPQFTSPIVSQAVTDTFYAPSSDLPCDTIYWRVSNDADMSAGSTVSSFRIIHAIPTLIACTPNPTYNRLPQFLWHLHSAIATYRLQIDTTRQFTSPIVSEAVTDTFYTPLSDLPYDTIYWRVRNDADSSSWSTVSSVIVVTIPQAPALISVTASSSRSVQLTWQNNDVFTSGYIILRKDSSETVFHMVDSVKSAAKLNYLDIKNLCSMTLYTYQIKAYNVAGVSDTSNSMQVTTRSAVPNTLTWIAVTPAPTSNNLISVAYGNGRYVAVGDNATIMTSPDGSNWTAQSGPQLGYVTFGNGKFLAVKDHTTYTSSDGQNWSGNSVPPHNAPWSGVIPQQNYPSLSSITYGNGKYVTAGEPVWFDDTNTYCSSCGLSKTSSIVFAYSDIYYSSDCINWSYTSVAMLGGGSNPVVPLSVFYFNGHFSALGHAGGIGYYSSSDGSGWSYGPLSLQLMTGGETPAWLIYGSGQTLVGGNKGIIYSLPDGSSWDSWQQSSMVSVALTFAAYSNGQYVSVGSGGTILNSPNAVDWAVDTSGTANNLNSVAADGAGRFVAVGNSGTIVVSTGFTAAKAAKPPALSTVLKVNARNSLLTISLPSAMLGKAVEIAVYSVSGREIMRKKVKSNAERFTVPVSFSYGSYILVANDGSRKSSVRFVAVR